MVVKKSISDITSLDIIIKYFSFKKKSFLFPKYKELSRNNSRHHLIIALLDNDFGE